MTYGEVIYYIYKSKKNKHKIMGDKKYHQVIGIRNSIYDELKRLKFKYSTPDKMLSFSDILEKLIEDEKKNNKNDE